MRRVHMRVVVGLFVCGLAAQADAQSGLAATAWEGPFAGVHLGPDFQSSELGNTTENVVQLSGVNIIGRGVIIVPGTTRVALGTRPTDHSFIAGLEGGWDHRYGDWVGGLVADVDFGGQSSSTSFSTLLPPTALTPITSISTSRTVESGVSLSLRARAGYVWNDTLIYGTGGLALTRLTMSAVGTWISPGGLAAPDESPAGVTSNLGALGPSTTVVSGESHMKPGWTIGIGAERHVIPTISVGAEYRYTRLASATFDLTDRNTTLQGALTGNTTTTSATVFTVPAVQPGSTDVKFRDHRVLVRATWRFDLR